LKNKILTYCLLIITLFAACFNSKSGCNSISAAVNDSTPNIKNISTKTDTLLLSQTALPATAKLSPDSIAKDTVAQIIYKPSPTKAIWYSALCPGLGQLYNRRYWKLPIIGAGIVGIAYAIGWNSKEYNAYTNGYRDISDNNPKTTSYTKLLPPGTTVDTYGTEYLTSFLKNRQQSYRRYRDLSFISAIGLYFICMLDAYVDAQLYDFDISPNLTIMPPTSSPSFSGAKNIGLSLAFNF